jgi:hypothetical protein
MSGKKKGKKTIKPNLSLRVNQMEGSTYNIQQPCTNGDKCKRGKNHFTGTQAGSCKNQIACLPFLLSPPLTQVVFDYPPLEFDLTPLPSIPMWVPFPQSVLFLPEYFLIENT